MEEYEIPSCIKFDDASDIFNHLTTDEEVTEDYDSGEHEEEL